MNTLRRSLIISFACFVAFTHCAYATSDETSTGWYSYHSGAFSIRLLLDLDGAKNVMLNGKSYPGKFSINQSGRHDGVTIYSISVPDAKHKLFHEVQIAVRFDDSDKVRAVAGFYAFRRLTQNGKEASDIIGVRTFVPVFERVMIEDLPSAKK